MQPIPDDILTHFNTILEKKSVPSALRDDYQKWLRYYLDFRAKYNPSDDKSGQVRLFIEKMRSKNKAGKDLYHAAHALSLFFSLQYDKKQASSHAERIRDAVSGPDATPTSLPAPGLASSEPTLTPAPLPEGEGVKRARKKIQ